MSNTGPTFVIPCHRAQELADLIDAEAPKTDHELVDLSRALRAQVKGAFLICVAEEDFVLWPGGPDIRDYQLGGGKSKVNLIHGDNVYSNDPADLPTRQGESK